MERQTKRIKELPDSIRDLLSQLDQLKGQWIGGAKLNPQVLGRLKRSVLVTSTGASTRIEGSRMSDEDVEKFMRGMTVDKFADRDHQEVRGYYEALENVFDSWKHLSVTEGTIKQLHKELLKFTDKDERHRGDYKKTENSVVAVDPSGAQVSVVFQTSPAYLTPKRMQELVEWVRDALKRNEEHPLLVIGSFVVEFLAIHPFQDGNGRLSRILTNLLMLKTGYEYVPYSSHEKFVEDNKTEYYIALRRSQGTLWTDAEDITAWLEFFFGALIGQARLAIELLSHENVEKLLSPKQLAVWHYLGTVREATPGEISIAIGVARSTVSQAIDVLMRLKKVERLGRGRTTRYARIVPV